MVRMNLILLTAFVLFAANSFAINIEEIFQPVGHSEPLALENSDAPNEDLPPIDKDNEQFAVICLKNTTHFSLNYAWRTPGGQWVREGLPPGWQRNFAWRGIQQRSIIVDFDYDMDPSRNSHKNYRLDTRPAQFEACEYGRPYHFELINNRYLDIYAD